MFDKKYEDPDAESEESINKFTEWVICPQPNSKAFLRLFCFPYAGGGSTIYRLWWRSLPTCVETCPIQLPGRENRLMEKAFMDHPSLIKKLREKIEPFLDKPFAFFGHSMGAMIAFELARELRRHNLKQPEHIFVSGRRAPQIPSRTPLIYKLPDPEFQEEIRKKKGTPDEIFNEPELLELILPVLRADFTLSGKYVYQEEPPLSCNITAFGGHNDPEATYEDVSSWKQHSEKDVIIRMFEGHHFFINSARNFVLQVLSHDLEKVIDKII